MIKSPFILNKKKYSLIDNGHSMKLKDAFDFRCRCGQKHGYFAFDTIFDVYNMGKDPSGMDIMHKFESMEVKIKKCTQCGTLYLYREWGDYDYFLFQEVEKL